jgi:hypothetical protein
MRLHAALCGYETSSLSVGEQHSRLGIFKEKLPRRILEEITLEC